MEVWTRGRLQRFLILSFLELSTRKLEIAGIASIANGLWMPQIGRNVTDAVDLQPQSVPNSGLETLSRSSSGCAPVPARSRAVSECQRSCCGPSRTPDWTKPPGCGDTPKSRFSSAIRTTKASISPAARGRPGLRWSLPSYFCAISLRCQADKVSGRNKGGNLCQNFPSQRFRLSG